MATRAETKKNYIDFARTQLQNVPSTQEIAASYGIGLDGALVIQKAMQAQQDGYIAAIAQYDNETQAPVNTLSNPPVTALSTASATELSNTPVTTTPVTTPVTAPAPTTVTPVTVTAPAPTTATPNLGVTSPQGITTQQLNSALQAQQAASSKAYNDALQANQTALTTQNANFLKNWDTNVSSLKSDILSGVDAKNKEFGTQATQGFMDAFKNFQIPTNQQNGVNMGNYNDNRNAAADQWWSQYVTGRR